MKDGSVILSIKDGEITKSTLRADLDYLYRKMFLSARSAAFKNPNKIINGIKAILFGCCWIEAKSNNLLKYLIDNELVKENFRKSVWESLKRAKLREKLRIFSALAQDIGFSTDSAPLGKLMNVIEVRNRLAHAKEKEITFEESCPADMDSSISEKALEELQEKIKEQIKDINIKTMLANLFQELPEPDLMLELKAPKINDHLDTIKAAAGWLDSIYKRYCRSINIKVSSPKL